MSHIRLSETVAVLATIDPDAYAVGAQNTDVIDLQQVRKVLFIVQAGELGASATLDFEVMGDVASNGTFATRVTGKVIAQLTKAGSDDDKQALVEVQAEEAAAQGFRFVRGKLTIGVAACDAAVLALGASLRYSPPAEYDLASVDEISA